MSKKIHNPPPPQGAKPPPPPSPPRPYGSWDPINKVAAEMREATGWLMLMEGGYKIHIERHENGEMTVHVKRQSYTGSTSDE